MRVPWPPWPLPLLRLCSAGPTGGSGIGGGRRRAADGTSLGHPRGLSARLPARPPRVDAATEPSSNGRPPPINLPVNGPIRPASYKITADPSRAQFMTAIRRRGRIIKSDDNCRRGLFVDRSETGGGFMVRVPSTDASVKGGGAEGVRQLCT